MAVPRSLNEAAALLRTISPDVAEKLKDERASYRSWLEPRGIDLGEAEDATEDLADQASFMSAALDRAGIYCANAARICADRLRTARRIDLLSQILAAVGASAVIGAILGSEAVGRLMGIDANSASRNAALAAGLLSLLAQITAHVVKYRLTSLGGSEDLATRAGLFAELSYESIVLKEELRRTQSRQMLESLQAAISRGNELCRTVLKKSGEFDMGFVGSMISGIGASSR